MMECSQVWLILWKEEWLTQTPSLKMKERGEIEDDCDCYWKWVDWIWDLRYEKYAKRGMIEQGIDVDGRDVIIRDVCDTYD